MHGNPQPAAKHIHSTPPTYCKMPFLSTLTRAVSLPRRVMRKVSSSPLLLAYMLAGEGKKRGDTAVLSEKRATKAARFGRLSAKKPAAMQS